MVSISLLMLSCWTADQWLGKFFPLNFDVGWEESSSMLAFFIYSFWYSSCSDLLHMEVHASNLLFLSEACSPWEVHTKSLSCDQMNTGGLWASWCILATWTQELVSVSCGFRYVHTGPCGRIGLETPTWSICRAVQSQQAVCMRPVRFRTRPIGSARLSRVFYSRWESLTFDQWLSPTVPKLCKTLCGLARHT